MANGKQRKTSQLHRRYQKRLLNASGEVVVAVVVATAHFIRVATITQKEPELNNSIKRKL